jgi:hypothetical protein
VKLENALQQIQVLKQKNKELEEQLRGAVAGCEASRRDAVRKQCEEADCLVLRDSIIRNVESEHVRVQFFPGIRTEQLQRVIENLDYVMGDVYALVKKAKTKFPQASLVPSGVIRRRDMSWWRIGVLNEGYNWMARTLRATFVDSSSWIEDWEFGRDGLHINRSGARKLIQLYARVCNSGGRVQSRNN